MRKAYFMFILFALTTSLTTVSPPKIFSLVETNDLIYIRADGSIEPSMAPIQCFGDFYAFTDSIYNQSIVVERSNITIDASDYSLHGTGSGCGFNLTNVDNVTIENTNITGFYYGIYESYSHGTNIIYNNVSDNYDGINLQHSDYCKVSDNNADDNANCGILLLHSCNCIVERNDANNNGRQGIKLEEYSNGNTVSNNTAINNVYAIYLFSSSYCLVSGNSVANNKFGIELSFSSYCFVSSNNSTNNEYNIRLDNSFGSILRSNNMSGNSYNFGVSGAFLQEYIQDVDTSNMVNGKPVYYLINQDSITIDPFGYGTIGYLALVNSTNATVEGLSVSNNRQGVLLAYTTNSKITNVTAIDNKEGISLYHCLDCVVSGSNLTYNMYNGITFMASSNCCVSNNELARNTYGIYMSYSLDCSISSNRATHNECGIRLDYSLNNTISQNNFIDNTRQVCTQGSPTNIWDIGYPEGGNYWNDYKGADNNDDGIGEVSYTIDEDNQDNYPLTGVFSSYDVAWAMAAYHISVISNSTLSDFDFGEGYDGSQRAISFNVTGNDETIGFCRVTIPTDLINYPYEVRVNGAIVDATVLQCSNATHAYVYFTYGYSSNHVEIVPEFPLSLLLTLFVGVTTMAVALMSARKRSECH